MLGKRDIISSFITHPHVCTDAEKTIYLSSVYLYKTLRFSGKRVDLSVGRLEERHVER